MLGRQSDIAERLANAIRHHQRNLVEQDEAEKNFEILRQLAPQLEGLSDTSDKD